MTVGAAVRAHYVAQWGMPTREASFTGEGRSIGILKWAADANPEGVAIYTTVGASDYPMPGTHPTHRAEFHMELDPERDDVARSLAALGLYGVRNGVEVDHGHTVRFDDPLWPGTDMRTFLVMRPTDFLSTLVLPDGIHVRFLQAIPLYDAESTFKTVHGADELIERWEADTVPFWDPDRAPSGVG